MDRFKVLIIAILFFFTVNIIESTKYYGDTWEKFTKAEDAAEDPYKSGGDNIIGTNAHI